MKIQAKQYNLLQRLLKNYTLKKDINDISVWEASIVIEGILNDGSVKKENGYGKTLTEKEVTQKQNLFNSLVEKKSEYAQEKQMSYLKSLLKNTNLELVDERILKTDANKIIQFLTRGVRDRKLQDLLRKKEPPKLIKIKKIEEIAKPNLPSEWVMQNIEINGIIDFF